MSQNFCMSLLAFIDQVLFEELGILYHITEEIPIHRVWATSCKNHGQKVDCADISSMTEG